MKTPAQIRAFLSESIGGARRNPTGKKKRRAVSKLGPVSVKKTKKGFTFCRTVSKKETRQMAKVFDKVSSGIRGNPSSATKRHALHQYSLARQQYLNGSIPMSTAMAFWSAARSYGATPGELAAVDKRLAARKNPAGCAIDGRIRRNALQRRKGPFPGRLGSGSRFAACKSDVEEFYRKKGKKVNSSAVCAAIGRRAYGKKFQKLATAGKRRHAK